MKLRIHNNHLRIRVNKKELDSLVLGKTISMTTGLQGGNIQVKLTPSTLSSAAMEGNLLLIHLDLEKLAQLVSSPDEGFEEVICTNEESPTILLFQKDYVCVGRKENENIGLFPNPKSTDGTC